MKRIRVGFANTLIQFVDRDRGIKPMGLEREVQDFR